MASAFRPESRARRAFRWLLIALYLVAGMAHLRTPGFFAPVIPFWVPLPREVTLLTGLCEIAGAIGLMTPRFRRAAGLGLALYAVCVFPANIKHAIDDLGAGTGLGWWYHVPRLAAQPLIVWWALWAGGVTDWPWWRKDRQARPNALRREGDERAGTSPGKASP